MTTILISNTEAPNTYTNNSFLILLRGAEIPPTVDNLGGAATTSGDSLILTQFTLPDEATGGTYVKRD